MIQITFFEQLRHVLKNLNIKLVEKKGCPFEAT